MKMVDLILEEVLEEDIVDEGIRSAVKRIVNRLVKKKPRDEETGSAVRIKKNDKRFDKPGQWVTIKGRHYFFPDKGNGPIPPLFSNK